MMLARILLLLMSATIFYMSFHVNGCEKIVIELQESDSEPTAEVVEETKPDPMSKLIDAIIMVESHDHDDAVNNSTNAVGCMQIRPIMVREVNRILKLQGSDRKFILDDRLNPIRSITMFNIWKDYHHSNDSFETIARCWNGGTLGYKMASTVKYWNKVKRKL